MSENGPESLLSLPGLCDRLESAEAFLMASSIIAVRPPLSGLCAGAAWPRGPLAGSIALTPEALPPRLMSDGLVFRADGGDIGELRRSLPRLTTTSFSSNTELAFSEFIVVTVRAELTL